VKKILVIDDDLEIVELAKNRLEAHHYEVLTANDGAQGLALAKTQSPDLIILDVVMPNMDGYTFVQEIKLIDGLKKIPIMIVTAKTDMQDLFLNEGVSCCLTKPFKTELFLEKVHQLAQQ
jgi:CheY-like chemotaxis protein